MSERYYSSLAARLLVGGFTLTLLAILLSGCSTFTDHQEAGVTTPAAWTQLSANAATAPLATDAQATVEQQWWRQFADPTLDGLIGEALANNKNLQIAKERVEEARAGRVAARSRLFPEITAGAGGQRGNDGISANDKVVAVSSVDVQATWELDLFGRNQARLAEASALLESEEASQQAVRVGLLAEVARTYFEMRNNQRQLDLTRQNLKTQRQTLTLIQSQLRGALASEFDVQRAAAQVSTTAALIPSQQAAYDAARNRLNVLLGQPPGTRDTALVKLVPFKPLDRRILVAAPARVLATRPDVRAAERRFAASLAAREAATAELFPNISLTALFGLQSASIMSATPWGLAAGLVQPVLNFGRIEARINAADARQKQAYLTYQQTVLEGLENMENALSSYLNETTRNGSLTAGVAQNRRAAALARQQYSAGFAGLLDVLTAERNLLTAEGDLAASDARLRLTLVAIYTAAGGGWE